MSKENDYGFVSDNTEWLLARTTKSETLGNLLCDLQETIDDVQQLAEAAGEEATLASLGFGSEESLEQIDESLAIGQLEVAVTAIGNEASACFFNNDDRQEYARRLSDVIEALRGIREGVLEDHRRLKT